MSKVERIEKLVQALSPDELADFRQWFTSYDAALWDQKLERDIKAGKLNGFRDEVLAEHAAHRTKEL
ncbi:MAG: hypothetical protein K2Y37_23050 [Pirellulales bacterium]|nr:hypothetical protein [Pirellulales bacterium]